MGILLMALTLSAAAPAANAQPCASPSPPTIRTVVSFSHQKYDETLKIGPPGTDWNDDKVRAIPVDSSPRIKPGRVAILVRETNTALHSYEAKGTEKPSEDLAAIQGFVAALKPYMVGAVRATFDKTVDRRRPRPVDDPGGLVVLDLEKLEQLLWGPDGLEAARTEVIKQLYASKTPSAGKWAPGRFFSGTVETRCSPCRTLAYSTTATLAANSGLRALHPSLRENLHKLRTAMKSSSDLEDMEELFQVATDALAAFPEYLAAAAAVERAGRRLMTAASDECLTKDIDRVELSKAVELEVTIKAIDLGVAAVNDTVPELTVKAEARPDWLFRPSLGLSLLRASDAKYPTFTAKQVTGGFEVAEGGVQDSRVDWALMLSFVPRFLDGRDTHGFALWFPTFSINPSESVRAVGLGAGISWKALKFDAGVIWTKHDALDGQIVGQPLAAKEDLRTESTYGKGKAYVGFSIVGWAPFKSD